MIISFINKAAEKSFNRGAALERIHGTLRAKKIRLRLNEFDVATSLFDFMPPKSGPSRCHELTGGNRAGQLSVDLDHPYRLIFIPDHKPVPRLDDGGLDWARVTAIKILEVENTHGK